MPEYLSVIIWIPDTMCHNVEKKKKSENMLGGDWNQKKESKPKW